MTLSPKTVAPLHAATVPHAKKEEFLLTFSEDEFRDRVVRPLFIRKGLTFERDTCGTDEEGKDCIFTGPHALGGDKRTVIAVQTKRGNVTLSSKANDNLISAIVQLRTALETDIHLTKLKQRMHPDLVVLCASGKINNAARRHIYDNIKDTRIDFLDNSEFIKDLDQYYPEFWFGIDANKFPYLRKLKEQLLAANDTIIVQSSVSGKAYNAITQDNYVELYLQRITSKEKTISKVTRISGKNYRRDTVKEKELSVDQFTVTSVLKRPERLILVLGEGGSGKTTALRHMAYHVANQTLKNVGTGQIPIIVKATDLARIANRAAEFIGEYAVQLVGVGDAPFSSEDLQDGRVLLLVDALDEVTAVDQKAKVVEKLCEFHAEYPNCMVIMTTRRHSFINSNASISSFQRYELSSIDLRQASKIIERVATGNAMTQDQAKEVVRRIQKIHGMELSPLLVTLFVSTSDFTRKDIPANITEIFSKFTEMMLGRWDEKKGVAQQYQANLKDFLLSQVAFRMHVQKVRTIPLDECKKVFAELLERRGYKADVEQLFAETIHRSGLLRIDGGDMEFRHHLLQEFFAGRGVPSVEFFKTVVSEEWWRNALVFYFGAHPSDQKDLMSLAYAISGTKGAKLYHGAVSIGLAMQACYLSETVEKADVLLWVVEALAEVNDAFCEYLNGPSVKFPLHGFIAYYLFGRDAVGCDVMTEVIKRIESELPGNEAAKKQHETKVFWGIVGLLESGHIDMAEPIIRTFRPADERLLAALHLGCFYLAHQRIASAADKKVANQICKRLSQKVRPYIAQAAQEYKGILLELQQNEVKALDAPKPIYLTTPLPALPEGGVVQGAEEQISPA